MRDSHSASTILNSAESRSFTCEGSKPFSISKQRTLVVQNAPKFSRALYAASATANVSSSTLQSISRPSIALVMALEPQAYIFAFLYLAPLCSSLFFSLQRHNTTILYNRENHIHSSLLKHLRPSAEAVIAIKITILQKTESVSPFLQQLTPFVSQISSHKKGSPFLLAIRRSSIFGYIYNFPFQYINLLPTHCHS